ncbi:MAG TPA: hypothetical protein VNS58_02250 [Puia sp.]|nr:hypothetical protein [Puia sp.]
MLKKCVVALIVLALSAGNARSQTIGQLLEQLSLDVQKLSELKTILNDMYTDYAIVNKGYTDIRNIAEGNFNLHKLFLDGLLLVSPAVRNYPRVPAIIDAEYSIVREYKTATARAIAGGHFTPEELTYLGNTYSLLFRRSAECIESLTMVMTDNQLRLSDDGRIQTIDRIYADITGQLKFLRQFDNAVSLQAIQRLKAAGDVSTLQKIYGITN